MSKAGSALKRVMLGRPMASSELEHTLLPKAIALPVFASDALSSMSYATQEVMLVLGTAGVAALTLGFPITIAVSLLLGIVIVSYRQIVRAYPGGGGAYVVARENLGELPGLVVAAALLVDYVLTVAVSITAGADAIASAITGLNEHKVALTIVFVVFVTVANLRGSKESGVFFAIPTYGFIATIYLLLITGAVRCLGGCPLAESAGRELEAEHALGLFLIARAFAAGTTALTGVEAIAEGVPVFRFPQSRNAAATLGVLAVFSISMFLGLSWLADHTQVVFTEDAERTVVAQIGHAIFGGGFFFYLLQVMTAAILVLAANTAYTGFPVLSSILAQDKILPSQFKNRGDRLVYSNGIVILAIGASLLIYIFDANLTRLIQLYLVGVFLSFTLAQFGTVQRWRRTREPKWRRAASINFVGAVTTGIVMVIVVATKFALGAWIVVAAIPVIMFMMHRINTHYTDVAAQLRLEERRPTDRRAGNQHMVILVTRVDASAARAVGYARSVRPASLKAVTYDRAYFGPWKRLAPDIPLEELPARRPRYRQLISYLRGARRNLEADDFLTVMIPEVLKSRNLIEVLRRPWLHRLKALLVAEPDVQVMDVPIVENDIEPGVDQAHEPARHYALVLVSDVHNSTLNALEYADNLRATDVRAVHFGLDPQSTGVLGEKWLEAGIPHPLEIEDSPFRDIGASLRAYVKQFRANGVDRVVTIVIPEFLVTKRSHRLLHGQNALLVKRHMLFEPGIVVVSVPYHLYEGTRLPKEPSGAS